MLNKVSLIIILFSLGIVTHAQEKKYRVGFLSDKDYKSADLETKAAYDFLKGYHNIFIPDYLTFFNIAQDTSVLDKFDVIWIHKPDTTPFNNRQLNPLCLDALKSFVHRGGGLLLTLEALHYLHALELEAVPLQSRWKHTQDEGYGKKLGLHAMRKHPLFEGLHGGAFIYNPVMDIGVRQLGYFDTLTPPQNGKVVAVDWDYIFLRENTKLAFEYSLGIGKILGIGAYTYLAAPNYHNKQLKLMLINALTYLGHVEEETQAYYWDYTPAIIQDFTPFIPEVDIDPNPQWTWDTLSPVLRHNYATKNSWDVATPQLLILGDEKGRIEEIWAHPFLAFRDFEVGIKFSYEDTIRWMSNERPEIEKRAGSFTRHYKFSRAYLTEQITASRNSPVGVAHYAYRGVYPAKLYLRFKGNFRLMWPYSEKALGDLKYTFNAPLNAFIACNQTEEFATILGSDKVTGKQLIGPYHEISPHGSMDFQGVETDAYQISALCEWDLAMNDDLNIFFSASDQGLDTTLKDYLAVLKSPEKVNQGQMQYYHELMEGMLQISSPDKGFNEGYLWSVLATDQFFVHTQGLGKSLVAGYATSDKGWWGGHTVSGRPGYGWYFGRDGVWSALAMLDYGAFEQVREILTTYQKFQNPQGKIFHELSTSGVVHYDASDATPLYLILAGRYLKHSGDILFIKESWPNIQKAIDFCFSTDTDSDHLIENTNVGHGWVEGGHLFGSHSSLYLAACWAEALYESAYLAEALGHESLADQYNFEARQVTEIINKDFWNQEKNHLNHGKFKDGSYHTELTMMPTVPIYFGQVDTSLISSHLDAYASNNFSTDWGMRIIAEDNPHFHPQGYHSGSVWPLFTGWTALAEYHNLNVLQAYTHLMNNLRIYKDFALGNIEEVLHGGKYQPAGVCFHQCWSETMVIQPAIEGMLGFMPDAMNNKMVLQPAPPFHWKSLLVSNLRMGKHTLTMKMERDVNSSCFTITPAQNNKMLIDFKPVFPPGTVFKHVRVNGIEVGYHTSSKNQARILELQLNINEKIKVEIEHENGISVLPLIPHPKAGDKSGGFRLLNTQLLNNHYHIWLEGLSGNREIFQVQLNDQNIDKVENAIVLSKKANIYTLQLDFEESQNRYSKADVIIQLK